MQAAELHRPVTATILRYNTTNMPRNMLDTKRMRERFRMSREEFATAS